MDKKIAVITLGCSKNLVDSERLMMMLNDVEYAASLAMPRRNLSMKFCHGARRNPQAKSHRST